MTLQQLQRCPWATTTPLLQDYHDHEWGVPCRDEQQLFELLCLESLQSGLSWQTVLKKRAAFRTACAQFEPSRLQTLAASVPVWLQNPDLIRHRGKLAALVTNAQALVRFHEQGQTLSAVAWSLVSGVPLVHHYQTAAEVPATLPLAQQLSQNLKRAGFKYVGPVTCYSWLQAAGVVNDHLVTCYRHPHI